MTEDLGHAAAHYEETGNTSATKTDTKTVTLYADGSHYTHGGFDETTPAGNSYSSRTYTKETIEITITNKLKTGRSEDRKGYRSRHQGGRQLFLHGDLQLR